jgi:hypothetical protein
MSTGMWPRAEVSHAHLSNAIAVTGNKKSTGGETGKKKKKSGAAKKLKKKTQLLKGMLLDGRRLCRV